MTADSDTSHKGYAIFQEEITDRETSLNEYLPPASETVEEHGARTPA